MHHEPQVHNSGYQFYSSSPHTQRYNDSVYIKRFFAGSSDKADFEEKHAEIEDKLKLLSPQLTVRAVVCAERPTTCLSVNGDASRAAPCLRRWSPHLLAHSCVLVSLISDLSLILMLTFHVHAPALLLVLRSYAAARNLSQIAGFNAVLAGIVELKSLYCDESAAAKDFLKSKYPAMSEANRIKALLRNEKNGQMEIRQTLSIADQLIDHKLVRSC